MSAFASVFLLGLLAAACALTTPSREDRVPNDYEQFDKLPSSYKFHEFATTYWKASKICREEGAQLMVIDTNAEVTVVQQLFARFPANNIKGQADSQYWAWVGIHERGADKDFRTIDGVPVSVNGFLRWKSGYPVLPGASDCGVIERGSSLLADDPCEKRYPFICEYSAGDVDVSAHVRSSLRKRPVVKTTEQKMVEPSESTVDLMVEPVDTMLEIISEPVEPVVEKMEEIMVEPVESTVELAAESVVEPMLEI